MATPGVDPANIDELRRIAPDLAPSIARLKVPAYVLDRNAVVRWMNPAAIAYFGDLRGKRITQIVEREYVTQARQEFAAKMLGTVDATEASVALRTADGRRVSAEISSTTLTQHGSIVGVFGLADPEESPPERPTTSVDLTPRQLAVLRQLAQGHSTADDRRAARHRDRDGAQPRARHHRPPRRAQPARGRHARARARADLTWK